MLRTTLREENGEVVQVVHPVWAYTVAHASSDDPYASPECDEAELLTDWRHSTVDLAEGPLFRARIVRRAEDVHLLLLSLHHTIADGWTLTRLLDEIAATYAALDQGRPLPPAPTLHYGDFAQTRAAEPTSEDDEGLAHWRERLAGVRPLDVPTDHPLPARRTHNGAAVPVELSAEAVGGIARRTGTTPFAVVATAVTVVLGALSGSDDVTIGIPTSGRTHPDTAGILGFFTNTLPPAPHPRPAGDACGDTARHPRRPRGSTRARRDTVRGDRPAHGARRRRAGTQPPVPDDAGPQRSPVAEPAPARSDRQPSRHPTG